MKGVILAGGKGTRLHPLTKITNKHLLPVYDKPMVYYPIETLQLAGIDDLLIVTGGNNAGDFLKLIGNGKDFGLKNVSYAYQQGEGGIADALKLAEHHADGGPVAVMLGDNLIQGNVIEAVRAFRKNPVGAHILLKRVPDPHRFGVPRFDTKGRIVEIIEKPKNPPSSMAVIGVYLYDHTVFRVAKTLKPSSRGELEITDVNNHYLRKKQMQATEIQGWWTDAGTFDSVLRASNLVARTGANLKKIPPHQLNEEP